MQNRKGAESSLNFKFPSSRFLDAYPRILLVAQFVDARASTFSELVGKWITLTYLDLQNSGLCLSANKFSLKITRGLIIVTMC